MLEKIATRLSGVEYSGGYKCKCPCHDDSSASLSINTDAKGRIIFNCFAGCSYDTVKQWLVDNDLWPEEEKKIPEVLEDTYVYTDSINAMLFEKQKWVGNKKRFVYRKKVYNKWVYKEVLKGLKEVPLYNLPALLRETTDTIYLVEGEKCAKILNDNGLIATTNHDGAGKWLPHYNKWLRNKNIVICVDNDEPGRKHRDLVINAINKDVGSIRVVEFDSFPVKYDVYDYIQEYGIEKFHDYVDTTSKLWEPPQAKEVEQTTTAKAEALEHLKGLDPVDLLKALNGVDRERQAERKAKADEKKIKGARYDDYVTLFKQILGDLKKDIFSEDCMYMKKNVWQSAKASLGIVRSHAAEEEAEKILKYNRSLFPDHFDRYESTLTPQLLIDIPQWDGQDRIGIFANALVLSESQGFTPFDADQLITDWLVTSYRRVYDPDVRNRILILKGPQHIGKDWWITSFLYGAGQFVKDLQIAHADKDNFLQLSQAWFLKIGEYDRTARTEVSVLKEMITTPFTDLRAPYDEGPKRRYARCSFIAGCNINDILRDPTGSSRYNIIEIDSIKYNYPLKSKHDGIQILAQAKYLAEGGFKCADVTEDKLKVYLKERTPSDPADDVMEIFYMKLKEYLDKLSLHDRIEVFNTQRLESSKALPLIQEVSKLTEMRPRIVQNIIGMNKARVRSNGKTFYIIPDEVMQTDEEPDTFYQGESNDEAVPF
jgi:hypothetical protein